MKSCRHFRNVIPREEADELREADPQPCAICDSLMHRSAGFTEQWNTKPLRFGGSRMADRLARLPHLIRQFFAHAAVRSERPLPDACLPR
jgi:hypothetical protein